MEDCWATFWCIVHVKDDVVDLGFFGVGPLSPSEIFLLSLVEVLTDRIVFFDGILVCIKLCEEDLGEVSCYDQEVLVLLSMYGHLLLLDCPFWVLGPCKTQIGLPNPSESQICIKA